jgi:hypothetical protein
MGLSKGTNDAIAFFELECGVLVWVGDVVGRWADCDNDTAHVTAGDKRGRVLNRLVVVVKAHRNCAAVSLCSIARTTHEQHTFGISIVQTHSSDFDQYLIFTRAGTVRLVQSQFI